MNDRTLALLGILGASVALYFWSKTNSGAAFVTGTANAVGDALSGTPRGIRNNNPGNIRRTSDQWLGALNPAQVQALGLEWDPDFVQFDTPEHGLRALAIVLRSYAARGLTTVGDIISTYAPGTENNTTAYIAAVSQSLGVAPNAPIDVATSVPAMMSAITVHENGEDPYTTSLYVQAEADAAQHS